MKLNYYQKRKEDLRDEAIIWQLDLCEKRYLYQSDLSGWYEYFEKNGKRYGLLREFRENGII